MALLCCVSNVTGKVGVRAAERGSEVGGAFRFLVSGIETCPLELLHLYHIYGYLGEGAVVIKKIIHLNNCNNFNLHSGPTSSTPTVIL